MLGQTAELGLAGSLAGLDRAAAHAAATGLARSELLRLEPSLDFVHPVVRAAIYDGIDAHERAEHAPARSGPARRVRRGARAACVAPSARAARGTIRSCSRRCARPRRARSRAAPPARRSSTCAGRWPSRRPPAERGALLGELGAIERGVDLPAAIEHLREAVGLLEQASPAFGDAALQYARALASAGTDSGEAIESYSAAIHAAVAGNRPQLVEVATAELINASWLEAAYLGTAKTLLVDVRDDRLSGGFASDYLLALLAHWEVRRGANRERAVQLARRALAGGTLAQESTQGIYYALDALRAAGEHDAALAGYASALAAARRRGDLLDVGGLLGFRGRLLLDAGDLRAAEPDLRESIEFSAEHGTAVHLMVSAAFLADYLLETGDVDEAERVLARTGLPEQLPPNFHFTILLGARGRLRLARQEPEAALAQFEAIGRIAAGVELANPAEWPWRTGAAAALLALGRDEEARVLAAEELELARRWGAPRPVGVALRIARARRAQRGAAARVARGARRFAGAARRGEDAARARPRGARARRAGRGARPDRTGGRAGGALRRDRTRRAGRRGARRNRRTSAQGVAHGPRRADRQRAARGATRRRRALQQGDRADPVRHRQDGGAAPLERLSQARHRLAARAAGRARRRSSPSPHDAPSSS